MCERLIVLKFGGSVLDASADRGDRALRVATDEIYRWRREGWHVVAVVSALGGRTEELIADSRRLSGASFPTPGTPEARATPGAARLIAQGELECAARLGLACERAGVPAAVLSLAQFGLRAVGDALDAEPAGLDSSGLRAALGRHGVAIVPGFVGLGEDGEPRLFGRGGSDLSALYVAEALGADRCRLLKDVDGLYDRDPRSPRKGEPGLDREPAAAPRRFAHASYADALANDGTILQPKAVRFASRVGREFELGALGGVAPTSVGCSRSVFADPPPGRPRALRVALLGLGVVGGGVAERLRDHPRFELVAACAGDPQRARERFPWLAERITDNARLAACADADIVVEALGGTRVALPALRAALERGAHVVTANKRVLAEHGRELRALAERQGLRLSASAAVGGSAPILEHLQHLRRSTRPEPAESGSRSGPRSPRSVTAVLNGTANFVACEAARWAASGRALELQALCERARALGFAEADSARDLDGSDAADKLYLIAETLGLELDREAIACGSAHESLSLGDPECAWAPLRRGTPRVGDAAVARQVATLDVRSGRASVRWTRVSAAGPHAALAELLDEENAALFEYEGESEPELVRGRGAGRWPTAQSVLGDLLELERETQFVSTERTKAMRFEKSLVGGTACRLPGGA